MLTTERMVSPVVLIIFLLTEVLRKEWGFKGHILSDCWAIADFYTPTGHHTTSNQMEASALAVKSGVSLNCGDEYPSLVDAVKNKSDH